MSDPAQRPRPIRPTEAPHPTGWRIGALLVCGLTFALSSATVHAVCDPAQAACEPTKKHPPKRHASSHRRAQAPSADPDLFVARPITHDSAKPSKAPAKPIKRAQP